jgi:hypothetical protein
MVILTLAPPLLQEQGQIVIAPTFWVRRQSFHRPPAGSYSVMAINEMARPDASVTPDALWLPSTFQGLRLLHGILRLPVTWRHDHWEACLEVDCPYGDTHTYRWRLGDGYLPQLRAASMHGRRWCGKQQKTVLPCPLGRCYVGPFPWGTSRHDEHVSLPEIATLHERW